MSRKWLFCKFLIDGKVLTLTATLTLNLRTQRFFNSITLLFKPITLLFKPITLLLGSNREEAIVRAYRSHTELRKHRKLSRRNATLTLTLALTLILALILILTLSLILNPT